MKRNKLIFALLLLCLLTGFCWWGGNCSFSGDSMNGGENEARHKGQSSELVEALPMESLTGPSLDSSAHTGARVAVGEKASRIIVAGVVVDPENKAIAGARVCLKLFENPLFKACPLSDASGQFEIEVFEPRGAKGSYQLFVSAQGFKNISYPAKGPFRVLPDHPSFVRVVLDPGRSIAIEGIVRDVAGGPIADAWVSVHAAGDFLGASTLAAGGLSDEEGRFRMFAPSGPIQVEAVAEGYAFNRVWAMAPTGGVTVVLSPESGLAGRVIDGQGRPVIGANVSVFQEVPHRVKTPGRSQQQQSGADGRFRFAHLQAGNYVVTAQHEHQRAQSDGSVQLPFGAWVEDIALRLHAMLKVEGLVRVADTGQPCPQGTVRLLEEGSGFQGSGAITAEGQVTIAVPGRGHYTVQVDCTGYAPRSDDGVVVVEDQDVTNQVWYVDPGVVFSGIVVNSKGTPVAGAQLRILPRSASDRGGEHETQSDAQGKFAVSGLQAGSYGIAVKADGYAQQPWRAFSATAPDDAIRIVLETGATVSGQVRYDDGTPAEGLFVRLSRERRTITDADGNYRMENLPAGQVYLRVMDRAGWSLVGNKVNTTGSRVSLILRNGEELNHDFVLPKMKETIRGTVINDHGSPVFNAYVYAIPHFSNGSLPRRFLHAAAVLDQAVITDAEGQFELSDLLEGIYTLRAMVRGGGEATQEHVPTGATIQMTVDGMTSVSGTLSYEDGSVPEFFGIEAVHLALDIRRKQSFFQTKGEWHIDGLQAGAVEIIGQTAGGRVHASVQVPESGLSGVQLVFDEQQRTHLRGRVVSFGLEKHGHDPTPNPLAGFRVVATSYDAALSSPRKFSNRRNITDADGRFELPDPPVGAVTVHVIPQSISDHSDKVHQAHFTVDIQQGDKLDLGDIKVPMRRKVNRSDVQGNWGFIVAPWNHDGDQRKEVVRVVKVASWVERQGLRVGDIITMMDGYSVQGNDRYLFRFWRSAPKGVTSTFGTARGEVVTLTTR